MYDTQLGQAEEKEVSQTSNKNHQTSKHQNNTTMRSFKVFTFATLMSFVLLFALISQQQTGVQAGKKKMMKNALMAALLLHGGKKILFPFPIPIPVP